MKRYLLLKDMIYFLESDAVELNEKGEVSLVCEDTSLTAQCIKWLFIKRWPKRHENVKGFAPSHYGCRVYQAGFKIWELQVADPYAKFEEQAVVGNLVNLPKDYLLETIQRLRRDLDTPEELAELAVINFTDEGRARHAVQSFLINRDVS